MRSKTKLAMTAFVLATASLVWAAGTPGVGGSGQVEPGPQLSNLGEPLPLVPSKHVLTVDGPRANLTDDDITRIVNEARAAAVRTPTGEQMTNFGGPQPVNFSGHVLTGMSPRAALTDADIARIVNEARAQPVEIPTGDRPSALGGMRPYPFTNHVLTGESARAGLTDADIARAVNEARAARVNVPDGLQQTNMGSHEAVVFGGHVLTSPSPSAGLADEEIAEIRRRAMLAAGTVPDGLQTTNLGDRRPVVFGGHDLTVGMRGGPSILYAPSESDDATFRAAISTACGGATVDYFDARASTPGAATLATYDCVFTWADFSYADNVLFGDRLADYVDNGGKVILGAFCTYTRGNYLSGRIMTPAYCPVDSPPGTNHFSSASYIGDGATCIHDGVTAYDAVYRDYLVLQGAGVQDGTYDDGEIAQAFRPDYRVIYSNGAGGSPVLGGGDWAQLICSACSCSYSYGARILYAPSDSDDPSYRAAISTACNGATVDYFDARAATPSPALLRTYDCVYTWANYAYADNVLFGDRLADYVDDGGKVVLGVFCTFTLGNYLDGRIMTPGYCPVDSPSGDNHYSSAAYIGDGTTCIHNGVTAYDCAARDYLILQGAGMQDGTYDDGEIAHAYRPDFRVIYSNGGGASVIGGGGDWPLLVCNACSCGCCYRTRILYAPANADEPAYRSQISQAAGGATVDYFHSGVATPSLALLTTYDCVYVWSNVGFHDSVLFGDRLADYVDRGGKVILGPFCTVSPWWLDGRIMTPEYCPVDSPTASSHYTHSLYINDGRTCIHNDVAAYDCQYRDVLVLQGAGIQDGSYADGEITHAYRPDMRVIYSNGGGGAYLDGGGDWPKLVANGCKCIPQGRILYAPSDPDNAAFRASVSAAAGGATVDYYDARAGTPSLALLTTYDCVFTWVNFAYNDAALFGDGLADYVDLGGKVILGQFCIATGQPCSLGGRIMTPAYNPATATTHVFDSYDYDPASGTTCIHNGVDAYGTGIIDVISPVAGALADGRFVSGEITHCYRPDWRVFYSTGNTGMYPGYSSGDWPQLVANMCMCEAPRRILYAPSNRDDSAYRAAIAAECNAVVDYYNAELDTPSLALLRMYDCVYTWVNVPYADNVLMGDRLADYADLGGRVILGPFCTYTWGYYLDGRIMTPEYCPVDSPTGDNHFSFSMYHNDGITCIHDGVTTYDCMFRDVLVLQGAGVQDGSYDDGEIAHAYRPDFRVIYSNGGGGSDLGGGGDWPRLVCNACSCSCRASLAAVFSVGRHDPAGAYPGGVVELPVNFQHGLVEPREQQRGNLWLRLVFDAPVNAGDLFVSMEPDPGVNYQLLSGAAINEVRLVYRGNVAKGRYMVNIAGAACARFPICYAQGDVNCSGDSTGLDLGAIQSPANWNHDLTVADPRADINRDGQVTGLDLAKVQAPAHWNLPVPPLMCECP